jgi:hypothetical protein
MTSNLSSCKICGDAMARFGQAKILSKYDVNYFRCTRCGFIQTERPYWLSEAYSSAIAATDLGPVNRAVQMAYKTRALILTLLHPKGIYLDYGAGWGLFVRRMRDLGFDFHYHDAYSANLFARGFESPPSPPSSYELVTAIEVVEHMPDPLDALAGLRQVTENILFTTEVVPEPAPAVSRWWYYTPEHGQHVSFFSRRSLQLVARNLGYNLYSSGSIHLLSTRHLSRRLFAISVNESVAAPLGHILAWVRGIESLLPADFEAVSGTRLP